MAALAHLGVQYMPSTGACMIDMAAAQANLFDVCGSIHIRMPEIQHNIDVQTGMICIKPTEPSNPVLAAYREQYMYPPLAANPPSQSPAALEAPSSKPAEGGNEGSSSSSKPNDIPNVPVDQPKGQSPSVETQEAIPAAPSATTSSTCTSSMMLVTSTFLTQVTTSVSREQQQQLSTFVTTTPSSSSSIIPATSASSSPTPEQPPVHIPTPPAAAPPAAAPPASPTPPAPVRPAHPDQPAPPHPAPVYCDAEYLRMDVTTISGLDPHDLALYLDLLDLGKLGLDLDLDHGVNGLVGGLLGGAVDDDETRVIHKELEHAYRVKCGVPLPRREKGKGEKKKDKKKGKHDKHDKHDKHGKGKKGDRRRDEEGVDEEVEFPRHDKVLTAGSRKECVEACEMGAIEKAKDKVVRECLGAAWHPRLGRENCRYWTGASDEVLPVDELGREETGEWEFVYL
ncbi:hypothetical protein Hte_009291 [Hypoxylon texense]